MLMNLTCWVDITPLLDLHNAFDAVSSYLHFLGFNYSDLKTGFISQIL